MHADLVGAAGFDAHAHEREFAEARFEALHHFVVGDGCARVLCGARGHARAAHGIAADGGGDASLLALDAPVDEGDVGLADLARREELGELAHELHRFWRRQ